jgi:ligand-binding sensor domain-containing protein
MALNSSHGLPQNSIRAITQDQNGFMWFATEDGIARYDGLEMKVYRYDPNATNSIVDNVASNFLVEENGRLWVALQGEAGVTVLDQSQQAFHTIKNRENDTSKNSDNTASAIYQKSKSEILIGTIDGVFSVSSNNLQVTKTLISRDELKNSSVINGIWEDNNGRTWVSSQDGKIGYISEKGKFTRINHQLNNIKSFKRIEGFGDIIIAGENGLFLIDYKKEILSPLFNNNFLKDKNIRDVIIDKNGFLWLSTKSGLIRYDIKNKIAVIAKTNQEDENSLPSNNLTSLFLSTEEILWIGSTDKGVIRTDLKKYGFTSYSNNNLKQIHPIIDNKDSIKNNMIWSIFRDSDKTLWIGHSEGVSRQKFGESTYSNISKLGNSSKSIDIHESWIMSITEANGYLWFGTWGEGLIRYSPKTEETVVYSADSINTKLKLSGDIIRWLLWDKERNSLWVGTHRNGLNKIDFVNNTTTFFEHNPNDESSFPHQRTRALYLDNKNRLWAGSGGGLARYDDASNSFKRVRKYPDGELPSDVRGIYQSDDNTLWTANGYGLDLVDIETLSVKKRYLEKDGLSRSALYGIIPDLNGKLWIPTIKGLTLFDPKKNNFKRFYVEHNLQSNEFNFNASWQDNDGSIILGGIGGITKFHPDRVVTTYQIKKPVILGVTAINDSFIEEKVLGVANESVKNTIKLKKNQRSILVDFITPEYTLKNNTSYQYNLEKNNDRWVNITSKETPIRYTNLTPGAHTLKIRSTDGLDNTSESLSIKFHIDHYFWEEVWFWLLSLLSLLILITYIIKKILMYRITIETNKERNNLYGIIIHDLGPSLKRTQESLSKIKLETDVLEFKNITKDNQYALSFIEKLRDLTKIDKKNENDYLLEDIWDESIGIFKNQIERIKIIDLPDISVRLFENSLQFIVRNLLSNSLNHSGSDGIICVSFLVEKRDLIVVVSDTGCGFSESKKDNNNNLGIGLTLIKGVISKYKGSIIISNNTPKGTIVTVKLKNVVVNHEH